MKRTLVLGASTKPDRYSNKAMFMLKSKGHEVLAVGAKEGEAFGIQIQKTMPNSDVDTVTMYLSKANQEPYVDALLSLKPKRIIFNPGAQNKDFAEQAKAQGVEVLEACTLVMLSIGNY